MQWIRAHRYTVALIAFAILVVTGGVVTKNGAGSGTGRGGVENVSVEYPYYAPPITETGNATTAVQANPQNASSTVPRILFFGNAVSKPKEPPSVTTAPPVFPKAPEKQPVEIQGASVDNPYTLFFRTLSNILSSVTAQTPEQKALYDYGNSAGALVQAFEQTHTNATQVLKTFFDSRVDPSRAPLPPEIAGTYARIVASYGTVIPSVASAAPGAQVQALANEYAQLGTLIGNVRNIPLEAGDANAKLAKGYADVAQGLSKLTQTENDTQLLDAINTYNASASAFIKNYVALVQLFSAYGVKFGANDPGAIFSFGATGL